MDQTPGHAAPTHVPLVEVTRGGIVESVHHGSFAVVDAHGTTRVALGDVGAPVYARSALKPLQLLAMVRAGLDLPDDLLALGGASHSGAREHQEGAERILALHGLDVGALRNVTDLPLGVAEREAWLRAGGERTQPAMNCSGKHAAMLATCVVNGWPTHDYLDPAHPLQRRILETLTDLLGAVPTAATTDGCGTPLFAAPLTALAWACARLASAEAGTPEARVVAAMSAHPEMVAGEGRDVTALVRAVPGLLAKDGAEGVQVVAVPGGLGVAVKISDGSDRARMPVTVAILTALGVDEERLAGLASPPVLGGGRPVGGLRVYAGVTATLRAAFPDAGLAMPR